MLPELPAWIRGRSMLLGDAAHATLPFPTQGTAMVMEDSTSNGLFPAGTKPENFVRTKAVEQLKSLMNGGHFVRHRTTKNRFASMCPADQLSRFALT
ncbi:hypothetical protein K438DRAFT_1846446 [Mycena galopus ATCC 62051]|nr:hypothetical protein K438DRAFT_1846446 [Mycena galopus ATCC 62051]